MLKQSSHARVTATDIAAIERRMQALEKRLERLSGSAGGASSSALQATDRVGEIIATALGDAADRFRGGARSVGDEAARFGQEAARVGNDALPEATERAAATAEQMAREGTPVRFLRSLFVPGDEICFFLFDGPSADAVTELARRAAITFERVLEVEAAVDERSWPAAASSATHRRKHRVQND